jgi:type I restriction enzyme S subunit
MTASLPLYPAYRSARVRWLGRIPEHWDEKRGKFFFREVDERSTTGTEEMLSVSHITGVTPRSQKNVTMFKAESNIGAKVCRPGDIAVNTMWAWMTALGISRHVGVISPAYGVYRPSRREEFEPEYLDYLLRTKGLAAEYFCRSKGVRASRLRLYSDNFLDIPFIRPPLAEQKQMVAFLRHQDRQIGNLIRNKRKHIQLLDEQTQTLIHRAVTRGLNPDTPLKPSGIEWLGDVPEHWQVRPLKQIAHVRLSGVDKHTIAGERAIRLCNYTDVYKNDFITQAIDFMPATARDAEIEAFALRVGDVLITKDSETPDDIAVPALVTETLPGIVCAYHLALIRPRVEAIAPEFLFRALCETTISRQFHVLANGVTRYGLSKHDIKNAVVPVPPSAEQKNICTWITDQLGPLTAAIHRAKREIALIREYRDRLISDVVTGQVDVRGLPVPATAELESVAVAELSLEGEELEEIAEESDADG